MEEKTVYYISEASKLVQVEPHVLRYWEDELALPIMRNEMGHRSYTKEDIERFQQIRRLKEQGLQLKAIRIVLQGGGRMLYGKETVKEDEMPGRMPEQIRTGEKTGEDEEVADLQTDGIQIERKVEDMVMRKAKKYMVTMSKGKETVLELPGEGLQEYEESVDDEKAKKAARLQYLLQHLVTDAVKSANREMCTEIKESILKELDYQFRQQEEREEAHWKTEEEHYRKIDEMIRQRRLPRERFYKGGKNKEEKGSASS